MCSMHFSKSVLSWSSTAVTDDPFGKSHIATNALTTAMAMAYMGPVKVDNVMSSRVQVAHDGIGDIPWTVAGLCEKKVAATDSHTLTDGRWPLRTCAACLHPRLH